MRCIVLRPLCALAVAAATFLLSNSSFAAILGGTVVGSSQPGVFELLPMPPATAGPNAFDSINLIGFNERQNVVLDTPLQLGSLTLPVGAVVSSHYVVFDPPSGAWVNGFVDFDDPILAIVRTPQGLDATDDRLGAPLTNYAVSQAIGPEPPGTSNDFVDVPPNNRNRLLFMAAGNAPGDHVRVITGVIPEPGSLLLFVSAIGGVAIVGFRRRS